MNELIQKLINQAKREDAVTNPYGTQDIDRVMEKLTKLVVEQCLDIADCHDNRPTDEWDKCARSIVTNIKLIFGVEK